MADPKKRMVYNIETYYSGNENIHYSIGDLGLNTSNQLDNRLDRISKVVKC